MSFNRLIIPWPLASSSAYLRRDVDPWTYATGYEILSRTMTVNSLDGTQMFLFWGKNGASTWVPEVGAVNVAEAGDAGAPTYSAAGTWGLGVDYNGARYHTAGSDAYGISTEDYALELVFKTPASFANIGVFGKYITGTNIGWYVSMNTTGRMYLFMRNGGTSVTLQTANSTFTASTIYHAMWFVDRSENSTSGARLYLNGALAFSGNPSSLSATTIDSASSRLVIGTHPEGLTTLEYTDCVYYVSAWKRASWFAGGASNDSQWLAAAAARYASVGMAL